jgi:hypothetical protein
MIGYSAFSGGRNFRGCSPKAMGARRRDRALSPLHSDRDADRRLVHIG